jgi:hypothetical protein
MRSFVGVLASVFPDMPKTTEVSRDEFIDRNNGESEFLIAENFDTIDCRIKSNPQANRGLQYALYDLFSSLRITNANLNINI